MVIYKKYFGNRLSHLIKTTGITQPMIVEALGVEPSTVYRWVEGKSLPDEEKTKALAKLFNITVEELAGVGAANKARRDKSRKRERPCLSGTGAARGGLAHGRFLRAASRAHLKD